MMIPPKGSIVLAASEPTMGINQHNEVVKHDKVNEVVYFPHVRGLGIQPHPEWDDCPQEFIDYCVRKIKEYLL